MKMPTCAEVPDGGASASPLTLNGEPAATLSSSITAGPITMLSGPGTTSFDEVFSPGDQVGVGAGLNASADAAAGCLSTDCSDYVGTATAAANGADTGRFFIDVLSAGGGYVSAS